MDAQILFNLSPSLQEPVAILFPSHYFEADIQRKGQKIVDTRQGGV